MKDKKDLYNDIDDNPDFDEKENNKLNEQIILSKYSLYVIPYKINEFELIKNIHERITFKNLFN